MNDLASLIERLEKADSGSNELDIAVEIALFDPPVSVRPNSAGTKLIYTMRNGSESTHWAGDHTLTPKSRERSISTLRALQSKGEA